MNNKTALICFSLLFYGPAILLVTIFLVLPFLLSLLNNPSIIADLDWFDIEVGAAVLVGLLPFFVSWGVFKLCRKFHNHFAKFAAIYAGWLVCATGISLIFFAVLGGASMAVADGGIQGWEYLRQALEAALSLYSKPSIHLIIFFWVAITYLFARKLPPELISDQSQTKLDVTALG